MSSPMPAAALPYGMRDLKLTPYADTEGRTLGTTSIDLPNMQTYSFSEAEDFEEMRGDDKTITTHGKGAQVEWELEAGGMSIKVWAILTGGTVREDGVSPNRRVILRKASTAIRGWFRIEGQAISDSGGDVHSTVYRCRCNDNVEGEFADGEFFTTSVSGVGLPLLNEGNDLLYDFTHNESVVTIPTTSIKPNPTSLTDFGTA